MPVETVRWEGGTGGTLHLIDQTRLPGTFKTVPVRTVERLWRAIKRLEVRGAPAIGVAAAFGPVLALRQSRGRTTASLLRAATKAIDYLATSRPTAVNLFWALERVNHVAEAGKDVAQIKAVLLAEAQRLDAADEEAERVLSHHGAELIRDGFTILTHCHTGSLATAGYGTALGVIKAAWEQGKKLRVLVGETRPLLQGARLTAWELMQYGIPFTLIADTMTGHFLSRGGIDCAIVGADRIAANGDVANKIGTYNIAVLAMENGVPFYVAAPTSTIDLSIASGDEIPIEERSAEEVTHIRGIAIAPTSVKVENPAFDITPHRYISAIITECGVIREPYVERLREVVG